MKTGSKLQVGVIGRKSRQIMEKKIENHLFNADK